ncbi:hypothetical protein ABPG77_000447 [Micractinium sp. CCAP 211/92]
MSGNGQEQAPQQQQPVEQPVQAQEADDAAGGQEAAADDQQQDGQQPMTKSQLKKLKKRQYYEERKQKRKEAERQRKQEEQARRREEGRQRMAAMTEEEQAKWREERNARGLARKQERQEAKARMEKALETGQKVVIDLDFADLMREPEQKSICGQLGYSWHANCAAQHPLHLVLSSVQGTMKAVLDKQVSGYKNWKATITEKPYIEHFADQRERLVYLTADSDNELQELDPEAIYIIGGIVDRNRHKLLCYNKAEQQGIKHARLPIGDYIKLASSQVMTTNHVVEIMLRWLELRDWKQAFEAVIPPRKRKAGEGEEDEEEGEGDEQPPQQKQQKQEEGQAAGGSGAAGGVQQHQAEEQHQQQAGGEEAGVAAAAQA